jgi:hypothetical protein
MSDTRLKDLVTGVRNLLSSELGVVTGTAVKAIFVEPGPTNENVNGIRAVIQRNPIQFNRDEMKVTSGTYLPDNYKITLVNFISDKNASASAQKMADAIQKIELSYNVTRKLYTPPTSEAYELCSLWIFSPILGKL